VAVGGVARDFNNILNVIIGSAELVASQIDPSLPMFADLDEIRIAAHRSAGLTRQLLAFARKQNVAPRVLDVNEVVSSSPTYACTLVTRFPTWAM
jgi:signal transduction histidine kinase